MTVDQELGCDRWPLHYACRTGNLEQVRYLVDAKKVSLNESDTHDATPLYLAALTGRDEICQYLLEQGAKCDPESGGDAARVFYVALTPELRRMLREWSLSAATRDPFLDILRKAFNDPTHADCFTMIGGEKIYLHYMLLYARCPRLANLVEDGGDEGLAQLRLPASHAESSKIMSSLLEYLYTGVFETRDFDMAAEAAQLALYYNLKSLHGTLEGALERYLSQSQAETLLLSEVGRFRCDTSDLSLLRQDMTKLARLMSTSHADFDNLSTFSKVVQWSDTTVVCSDSTWSLNMFLVCGQSDYFSSALLGGFRESQDSMLDFSHLVPSTDALSLAIQWMYADIFLDDLTTVESAVDVLEFGAAILCPRLCAYAANAVLIPAVDVGNVFGMLQLSKIHGLERLENRCVQVLAVEFESVAACTELRTLLAKESAEIVQKGDVCVTDIPIAAEIRSAIIRSKDAIPKQVQERHLELLHNVVQETLSKSAEASNVPQQ
eukprot:scaffold129080_cov44-Attheya_sp.AAC.5